MAYIRLEYPKIQAFTDNGLYAVGYKVYTYTAGTDTECKTYSDRLLSSENTNPIVLNARAEADLYTDQAIKLVLHTDADVLVWEQDYVGEQLATFYTGTSAGTTNNVYTVTVSPVPTAYTNNMTVIFTPDADNVDTIGTASSSAAGPDDGYFAGPYTGSTSSTFRVEIDATGATDTFKWRKDTGSWTTGVAITGSAQTLIEGMTIDFAVLTGHTVGDYWLQDVNPPAKVNVNSLGAKLIYNNVGGTILLISGGDIKANYPANLIYSSGQDCFTLMNPATQTGTSGGGGVASGERERFEKTDNYTLTNDDAGNVVVFNSASNLDLTLDPATNYKDMFFYIRAGSTGNVLITADGTEQIYGKRKPGGSTTYTLFGGHGDTIQLQCNGVSWEVMTESPNQVTMQSFAVGANQTYTKPWDVRTVLVWLWGGGGGGSKYASSDGNYLAAGGGGGGFAALLVDITDVATVNVTVGAKGTGGTGDGQAGTAGGTSSFGAYCTATGGAGGTTNAGSPVGGAGGVGSGAGATNLTGQNGVASTTAYSFPFGGSAPSPYGGSMSLTTGYSIGGGGSGTSVALGNGYNGADGACIVWEYR